MEVTLAKLDPDDVVTAKSPGIFPVPPAAYVHPLPFTMYDSPVAPVAPVAPDPGGETPGKKEAEYPDIFM